MLNIKDGALYDMQGSEYASRDSYFMFKILDTSKNHFHPHVWGTSYLNFSILSPRYFLKFISNIQILKN